MSLILITKTNSTAITPYIDSVRDYSATGIQGFYEGVGREGSYAMNDASGIFTIYNGMGTIYGRRFQLNEYEEIDFSQFNAITYATIYFELDCSNATDETITLKYITSGLNYPEVTSDDLISTANGIARIVCYELEYDGANDKFIKVTRKMPIIKPFNNEGFQNIQADSGEKAISMKGSNSANKYEFVERKTPVVFNESNPFDVNAPTYSQYRFVKLTDVTTTTGGRSMLNHTLSGFSLKAGYKYEIIYWNPAQIYDSSSSTRHKQIENVYPSYYQTRVMTLYCVQRKIMLDSTLATYNFICCYGEHYYVRNPDNTSEQAYVVQNDISLYSIDGQSGVYVNVAGSDMDMAIIINEIEGGSC